LVKLAGYGIGKRLTDRLTTRGITIFYPKLLFFVYKKVMSKRKYRHFWSMTCLLVLFKIDVARNISPKEFPKGYI
jgi:uncharacterized protein involved in response to NO